MKGFLAVTPDDADSSGIENLCKQLFKHFEVDVKELAELLVRQNYVTTVLKVSLSWTFNLKLVLFGFWKQAIFNVF